MMQCRTTELENTLQGLELTDVSLVSYRSGEFVFAGGHDDLGMYYFIPHLAKWLGFTTGQASAYFFDFLMYTGIIVPMLCFFFLCKSWPARLIACYGFFKLGFDRFFDLYSISFFAIAVTIPIFLAFGKSFKKMNWKWGLIFGMSGVIAGYSNIFRSQAGSGVLLFILFWILLKNEIDRKTKVYSLAILIAFTLLPYAHFKFLEKKRDHFLMSLNPSHKPISIVHPKWHPIYLGFSFLENAYNIRWDDEFAVEKAKSINPEIERYSSEYNKIIRDEVFHIALTNPLFIIKTVFAKIYAVLLLFFKFANLGLLLLFYLKPSFRTLIPFAFCLFFYSLPGILVMPVICYLSGMLTISVVFGIYIVCLSIEKFMKGFNRTELLTNTGPSS